MTRKKEKKWWFNLVLQQQSFVYVWEQKMLMKVEIKEYINIWSIPLLIGIFIDENSTYVINW